MQLIALITMIIDHTGTILFQNHELMKFIFGLVGVAMPVMASYIVTGIGLTRDIDRYILRVLAVAVIAQPAWIIIGMNPVLNDVFSLAVGMGLVNIEGKNRIGALVLYIILILINVNEYVSIVGFTLVYGIRCANRISERFGEAVIIIAMGLLMIVCAGLEYSTWLLVPILLKLFKGKEFKVKKVVKYSLYPVHLYGLALIRWMV